MRINGLKMTFSEEDVRSSNGIPVVYLDIEGRYTVPDPFSLLRGSYHWPEENNHKTRVENYMSNKPLGISGGLIGKLPKGNLSIILGGGTRNHNWIPPKRSKDLVCGVGDSLNYAKSLDLYVHNNPDSGCIKWLNPHRSCLGLFSCGSFPPFIKRFKGLKFFYSSGWEIQKTNLQLIDLGDPLIPLMQLLSQIGYQHILLINCIFQYKEYRPGTVIVGEQFMYPQQLLSLSMINAMIFWLRRRGLRIYTIDKDIDGENPPRELISQIESIADE